MPPAPDSADVDERRNIIVYIEQVPSGTTEPTKGATLRQHDERFLPHVLPVVRGTTVAFPNDDPLFHNVFSLSRAKSFDLGRYPRGAARSVTFDRAGIVQVFCHIHSDMMDRVPSPRSERSGFRARCRKTPPAVAEGPAQ